MTTGNKITVSQGYIPSCENYKYRSKFLYNKIYDPVSHKKPKINASGYDLRETNPPYNREREVFIQK